MTPVRVTMSDIARQAGVSKNTVSLALRYDPQIPERTRRRIELLAEKMGYQKDPTVSQLMVQLRKSKKPEFKATLALINANLDPNALTRHPTVPVYVEGCRSRAEQLGYRFDEFWLHDKDLDGERLNKILRTRDIRGIVVVGLMKENHLPARFLPIWEQFHTVVTGVRTHDPALSFACADHHMVTLTAFQKAIELGYKRPALVLDHVIDHLVDGRFSSGAHIAQARLPKSQRTRPFYLVTEAQEKPELFRAWFEQEKPDLILTLYNVVRDWIKAVKLRIPDDVGLVQLEWRKGRPDWAGMNQHNDRVGEAAVEMLLNMIHNHSPGIPSSPRATLIGSSWIPGATVRKRE